MPSAGEVNARIARWSTKQNVPPEEIWGLMNEVRDDVMARMTPWFTHKFGAITRDATSANNYLTNDFIPRPMNGGAYMIQANFDSGMLPDNQEYLRAIPFPDRLSKPIQVYYGSLTDNVKLDYMAFEPFIDSYPIESATTVGSTPMYYTLWGETFLLGPHPPLVMALRIFGIYKPQDIEDDNDENELTLYEPELLRWGVLDKLVKYHFEEDTRGALFEREYKLALRKLGAKTANAGMKAHKPRSYKAGTRRLSGVEATDE